ncbi:histidine phosphatase family protein [Pseudomonas sp. SXM-1]|uniref:lipopolysaccharide core heptose(II)-phosphate phosphatase PmrG n=1 Tax=Pseudomonas sp. SXM-1 TaxID=2169583 RepID=UPI0010682E70|nr:histidine phosphatase family protein [Pseudomonas sp. SXM-1]QBQ14428.1 histidine phosphatase family protein [Pseudomonas sp. SXM-1]
MANIRMGDATAGKVNNRTVRLSRKNIAFGLAAIAALTAATWYFLAPRVLDLGDGNNFVQSGLNGQWMEGNVIVIVRHAERCDRSSNPCFGPPNGITVNGQQQALAVAKGLQKLGLDNATLISSPKTRTQQTADLIAGNTATSQKWVGKCDAGFRNAAMAYKKPRENLVLITHSGCIDHFERTMRVPAGQRSSDYAEAFFIAADGANAPRIMGSLGFAQWKTVMGESSK